MSTAKPSFALSQDARIFYNGVDEIRIRKGIWNYTEATLSLSDEKEAVRKAFIQIFKELSEGKTIDMESLPDRFGLDKEQKNSVFQVMEALRHQLYLRSAQDLQVGKIISDMFGGVYQPSGAAPIPMKPRPALVFTDSPYAKKIAAQIAADMNYSVDIMDEKTFKGLCAADFTTKTDAIETIKETESMGRLIAPYSVVIGIMEKPSISFLRNLNRLLVMAEKPLILSLIDGPFITFLTINPPQTGCFECYENRLMARMENLAVYHNFADSTRTSLSDLKDAFVNPLLHALTGIAIAEGFLQSTIGFSKSSGRVVNVYLPVGEIQIQDLMRVPFCPACGFAARSEISELFTSSKMIVNKLLDSVNLVDQEK